MLATFNVDKLDNIGMYLENQAKQAAVHVILLNTIDKKIGQLTGISGRIS